MASSHDRGQRQFAHGSLSQARDDSRNVPIPALLHTRGLVDLNFHSILSKTKDQN